MERDNEYLIYNYNPLSYWIFILIGLIMPIVICVSIKADLIYFVIVLLTLGSIGFYLSRFGLQPIRVILTDNKIRLEYLSVNLKRIKKVSETDLDNIAEFSDYSVTTSQKITFYFKNKMTFELVKHGNFHRKDRFEDLILVLKDKSREDIVQNSKTTFPKYWDYLKTKDAKFWYICSLISIPIIGIIALLLKNYIVLFFIAFPFGFITRYRMRK